MLETVLTRMAKLLLLLHASYLPCRLVLVDGEEIDKSWGWKMADQATSGSAAVKPFGATWRDCVSGLGSPRPGVAKKTIKNTGSPKKVSATSTLNV